MLSNLKIPNLPKISNLSKNLQTQSAKKAQPNLKIPNSKPNMSKFPKAIASYTISLHPISAKKTKLSLKKFLKYVFQIFFSEMKFYITEKIQNEFFIFVFRFSFLKHNNFFSGFFFSGMYYFSIPDFFIRNRILIFVSEFFFSELNNHFRIYFSEYIIFNSGFLFPELRVFLEIKKICWVQVKNDWV